MNMDNITPLMQIAINKCQDAQITYEVIRLPDNLPLDVKSHIEFHRISMSQAIPTLVFKTENGFIVVQKRADTKINSGKLKKLANDKSLNFASPEELKQMQAEGGIVPLTGLDLPYYTDQLVLENDNVYGGSGSKYYALKMNSKDLIKINQPVIGEFTEII